MRVVVFDTSGVLEAFDYRGVLIHSQEVKANEKLKLPFTQKNLFNFNGVFFGVCEGVGDLDYRDYPKNLNFSRLNIRSLNDYLLFEKEPQDKEQKELVKEFLKIYDKNIEKGFYYLEPPFFKEKENELLKMRFETNVRS
ncbi:hypothetical protein DDP51_00840 [Helicobacter pylori]|uniref:hypothetical protein n=1 Tax=Helicobacter pylori TaxID=210 RepID=UPI000EAB51FE|nr:hypothetical protein [Helicobacter pylori]RKV11126.1 hypothetical protein DDP51_00840 [Helicobacter pylori]